MSSRILVLGLGSRGGGEGVVRFLHDQGHQVRVSDRGSLASNLPALERLATLSGVSYHIASETKSDVDWADWLVRNPAVPDSNPLVQEAVRQRKKIRGEMALFFDGFDGTIIAVTGTKGKTSTAHFAHHLLGMTSAGPTLVGNMGGSALDSLNLVPVGGVVVAEMSSFAIELLDDAKPADIAVLTNLAHDHLDRYATVHDYWRSKAALFLAQHPHQWRCTPPRSQMPDMYDASFQSKWFCVGAEAEEAESAIWIDRGQVVVRTGSLRRVLCQQSEIPVLGHHRVANVLGAVAAALASGVEFGVVRDRITDLPQVPHRLEPILQSDGRLWVNDTAATTPTAAAAGIAALATNGPLTLICGGSSKGLDVGILVDAIAEPSNDLAVVLLDGDATSDLQLALRSRGILVDGPYQSMRAAVEAANGIGGNVLLSPGFASFGMFRDEFDRGGAFVAEAYRVHSLNFSTEDQASLSQPRRPAISVFGEGTGQGLGTIRTV